MPDRAYAILISGDEHEGYIYFPIKLGGLRYAGMPQFFGGGKNGGETDRAAILRELLEESNDQITLAPGGLVRIYSNVVNGDTYTYYIAHNYTGKNFLGPLPGNNEMASIEKFYVVVGEIDGVEDLLKRLNIVPTQDFCDSETYKAFDRAIKWCEQAPQLGLARVSAASE